MRTRVTHRHDELVIVTITGVESMTTEREIRTLALGAAGAETANAYVTVRYGDGSGPLNEGEDTSNATTAYVDIQPRSEV